MNVDRYPFVLRILFIYFYLIGLVAMAQRPKQFYLLDSLPINKMSKHEKYLLDSILNKYHNSKNDSVKYFCLLSISEFITDPLVWPPYNEFLKKKLINKIKETRVNQNNRSVFLKILIRAINNEGLNYNYTGEFDKALLLFNEALDLAKKEKQFAEEAEVYNSLGGNYHFKGDLNNALRFYLKSASIYFKLKDNSNLALLLYNLAQVYYQKSDFNKAINFSLLSLRISEFYNNKLEIATTSGLIGQIFYSLGDNLKAVDYFNKAYEISFLTGSKVMMTEALINRGIVYHSANNYTKALIEFDKAQQLAEETNNLLSLNIVLINVSELYIKINDYLSAKRVATRGLLLSKELQNQLLQANFLNILAGINLKEKKFEEAAKQADLAYKLAIEQGASNNVADAALILKDIYSKKYNWEKAYKMLNVAFAINDSLKIKENQRLLYKKTYQFEYEKMEIELKEQQKIKDAIALEEHKVTELKLSRNRYVILILVLILLVSVFFAFLLLNQTKLKNERRTILLEQKLLRSQMNPHFIFNSLNSIHSIVLGGDSKSAGKYLATFSKLIRSILEGSRFELISLEREISFLKNYIELQKLRFENDFRYAIEVSADLDLTAIYLPPMLSQPFIENAIEHGLNGIESPLLTIKFYLENDFLCIEISDNGLGYRSYTKNKEHLSLATSITKERLALFNKGKDKHSYFEIAEANPGQINKGVRVLLKIRV